MSRHVTQNAFWVVLGAIVIGLAFPAVSHQLRPYTFGFLFVVIICTLIQMAPPQQDQVGQKGRMGKLLMWQLILSPILVWGVVTAIGLPDTLSTALIACACAGPVSSTPAFAKLMGLDDRFTVQNLMLSSILMPMSLIAAGYFLLPIQPDIDLYTFVARVGLFLIIPFLCGVVFRRVTSSSFQKKSGAPLLSISTISLALMACSLMDGITSRAIQSPNEMMFLVTLALGFNILLQTVTTLLFKPLGRDFAVNAGLVCGYRNWALTLALTAGSLGEDFTALVAIGQFGVMLLPLPSVRFFKKILGHPSL